MSSEVGKELEIEDTRWDGVCGLEEMEKPGGMKARAHTEIYMIARSVSLMFQLAPPYDHQSVSTGAAIITMIEFELSVSEWGCLRQAT